MNMDSFFDLYVEYYDFTPAIEEALRLQHVPNDKIIEVPEEEHADEINSECKEGLTDNQVISVTNESAHFDVISVGSTV